jgi:hypothetical protein
MRAERREAFAGFGGMLDQRLFHSIAGRVSNDLWWAFAVLAVVPMVVNRRLARVYARSFAFFAGM